MTNTTQNIKIKTLNKSRNIRCMNNLASCFCYRLKRHPGLHACRCGGSWDKTGMPHSFPNISLGYGAFPLTDEEEKLLNK